MKLRSKIINESRTHDKLYLNEVRKDTPKEYFKFIVKNLSFNLNNKNVIDIGCATGEFLHYLNKLFPNAKLYAADIDKELLVKAQENVPSLKKTFHLDISKKLKNIGSYDALFM